MKAALAAAKGETLTNGTNTDDEGEDDDDEDDTKVKKRNRNIDTPNGQKVDRLADIRPKIDKETITPPSKIDKELDGEKDTVQETTNERSPIVSDVAAKETQDKIHLDIESRCQATDS